VVVGEDARELLRDASELENRTWLAHRRRILRGWTEVHPRKTSF
jgi:hypothetical protein